MNHERRDFLAAAATIAAGRLSFLRGTPAAGSDGDELASLATATGWLNSPPLTAAGLKGKVVLVSFWTYTCINWLRSQPYIRAWAQKYRDRELVVIGVHSPEFENSRRTSAQRPPQPPRPSAWTIPSRWTATMRSGVRSTTSTGRPCTSSTPRDGSDSITSAKANTPNRRGSFAVAG